MENLLPYFERELLILRRHCREFHERYPRIAGRLLLSDEVCPDPHVEQLIQSVALLAARISKRLDDDYPQFTEALFETLFPHYLRPFPSCAIVRAYIEAEPGRWIALPAIPLAPVGFAEGEALIPYGASAHPAYRVLSEYFVCAEKFNFFDIDLAALRLRSQDAQAGLIPQRDRTAKAARSVQLHP